jgi:thiamine-monophosphate kinase
VSAADGGARPPHTALGSGREFDAVRALLARWGPAAAGVGDDCAVLALPDGELLCASTDSAVEGVHFRRSWLTAGEIGYRAATAALSDLAAMAARPMGLLLAVTVPPDWREELGALADGVAAAARAAGAPIVGGDTTAGERLSLTITVLGSAREPVARGSAQAGDRLYVTGRLGGPAAAVAALEAGAEPQAAHRARFAHPEARIAEARWLAAHGARGMIDVSDGLAADLRHVAAASGARLVVALDRVPCMPAVGALAAAAGGEEYELACAMAGPVDTREFEARYGIPLTEIGRVEGGDGEVLLLDRGARVDLPAGYDHFSSR